MLPSDLARLHVINPDAVCASKSDRVTTPDVLRVELSDVDVLNDDIFHPVCEPDALALDDTLRAGADDRLV